MQNLFDTLLSTVNITGLSNNTIFPLFGSLVLTYKLYRIIHPLVNMLPLFNLGDDDDDGDDDNLVLTPEQTYAFFE
jgi:hypothetical protein